jgi:hypothetical protein
MAFLLMLASLTAFAQNFPVQTDSLRLEKYRTEIGLDMSVPDFDTKSIDSKVMGTRLAGILDYLMKNYKQAVYSRKLSQILKEQVPPLEKLEFELKKFQLVRATKSGDEISLLFSVLPNINDVKVKQTDLIFHFKNGVSESQATNELFSMMSRYVQMIEELSKN